MQIHKDTEDEVDAANDAPSARTIAQVDKYRSGLGRSYESTDDSEPRESKTPYWLKPYIPIVISALLSACLTGFFTVMSIKQELAVQSASTALTLADHTRRITDLEGKTLTKETIIERDRRIDDAFKNLNEQVSRTDMNVDEMRRIIYEHFGQKR